MILIWLGVIKILVCGNVFSKIKKRVIIKMINNENEIDFMEYQDPNNLINDYEYEDFVIIKLDKSKSKISEAYFIDKIN